MPSTFTSERIAPFEVEGLRELSLASLSGGADSDAAERLLDEYDAMILDAAYDLVDGEVDSWWVEPTDASPHALFLTRSGVRPEEIRITWFGCGMEPLGHICVKPDRLCYEISGDVEFIPVWRDIDAERSVSRSRFMR